MNICEEIKNLIAKSQNIFVLLSKDVNADNLGGALSLFYILKKLGKNANVVLQNIPEKLKFLPLPDYLNSLKIQKNLIISLSNAGENISEIRYDKDGTNLRIHFFSKNGELSEKDFSFASQELKPDFLISLATKNLEGLGRVFEENPQIFYEKPILNIDNDADNEKFGEINFIEQNSSGVSEMIGEFLKNTYQNLIDENAATCLLAGIVYSTKNFQNSLTTSKNLGLASFLVKSGADHQKIILNLYKTKNFGTLRLLGRVLDKLSFNEQKGLYRVSLTREDFQKSNSSPKDLGFILEELKFRLINPKPLLILWESYASENLIKGIFYSPLGSQIKTILKNYQSTQKDKGVLFLVKNPDIKEVEKEILNML